MSFERLSREKERKLSCNSNIGISKDSGYLEVVRSGVTAHPVSPQGYVMENLLVEYLPKASSPGM